MYARASTAVSLMAAAVRNMSATVFFPRRRPSATHSRMSKGFATANSGRHTTWVDTLRNVTAAAGRKPLVVYYEALQVNPKREMRRVFTFAGLPPATKIKAESTSKKLTPEDLRATLLDFGKTAKFLRERRPGLHDQLVDTAHRVFKTLHLPGNRTGNFEAYEH